MINTVIETLSRLGLGGSGPFLFSVMNSQGQGALTNKRRFYRGKRTLQIFSHSNMLRRTSSPLTRAPFVGEVWQLLSCGTFLSLDISLGGGGGCEFFGLVFVFPYLSESQNC